MSQSLKDLVDQIACEGATVGRAHKLKLILGEGKKGEESNGPPFKGAVLSEQTSANIADALRCALAIEGYVPTVYEAPGGTVWQEVLDSQSGMWAFAPDLLVLALNIESFGALPDLNASSEEAEDFVANCVGRIGDLCRTILDRIKCKVIVQNFVLSDDMGSGAWERQAAGGNWSIVFAVNRRMLHGLPADVLVMDVDRLAGSIGLRNWHNPTLRAIGDLPFDPRYLPGYTRLLHANLRAAMGRIRKCLVTDLDNTLWRGVIGDDGLEGIEIGGDSPIGRGHLDFCLYLKELSRRGVILAVCSKNDPEVARLGFCHPNMPLRVEDLAAFHCSWENKADGIRAVARQLNIGTDALVFVDDNPAECLLIRQHVPEVMTINLPKDAARYRETVEAMMPFVTPRLSVADSQRAGSYEALKKASQLKESSTDLDSYLRSLEMRATMRLAKASDHDRLVQMEQRINQFNLTGRRYRHADLERIATDGRWYCFVVSLFDKFANHGIVSSIILNKEADDFVVDSWLVSCRAFSRGLEQFVFNHLLDFASEQGASRIIGKYVESERNGVSRDVYHTLGFRPEGEDGSTWVRELPAAKQPNLIISCESEE